jgi:tetratricopeptide (TPR) repeat protein
LRGVTLLAKGRRAEVDDWYPEGIKSLEEFRGHGLEEAMTYYRHIQDCDPGWTLTHNTLRVSPEDEARLKEAIDQFRQAVAIEPEFGEAHGALGLVLLARREFTEAEAEIRRSLGLVPDWATTLRANLERLLKRCQHLRVLEGRLPAIVQNKDKPAAADCRDLAERCFVKKHFATAARLYAEALAAKPQLTEDLRAGHRFNAARAAALAGCGHGDDVAGVEGSEQEGLRKQARDWLRIELAAWAKKVDSGKEGERVQAQKTLAPWRDDTDMAVLRDADALEKLPASERQEWRVFWQELATLLRRAETTK